MKPKPSRSIQDQADDVYRSSYDNSPAGHLNRAQRRTAEGRRTVLLAEIVALEAKRDFLQRGEV